MTNIMEILSNLGQAANTASAVLDFVQKMKKLLKEDESALTNFSGLKTQPMQPFRSSAPDPYSGGNQWLSQLRNLAGQHGDSWVPTRTQGLLGIDLTGIWSPPINPFDQTYVRQFGPYINVIAGVSGMPTLYAEGLFDPTHGVIHVVGRYVNGAPMEARAQLLPNWTIQGVITTLGLFGQPVQVPFLLVKVG